MPVVGDLAHVLDVIGGNWLGHRVGVRVLQHHQRRDRVVHVVRVAERSFDGVELHLPLVVPGQELHRRADDDGVVGRFVCERVRSLAGDDLTAARHLGHKADEIAHRAAGDEETGLLAGQLGCTLLERDDRWVVAKDVVAQLGIGHRPAHLGRRVRDRVGTEVDQVVGHGGGRV